MTALSSDQYTPSMFQDDLGLLDNVTKEVCNYLIERGSRLYQHSNYDFSESCTTGGHHNRYCSLGLFTRVHPLNGEKSWRSWLCYSPSKRRLYCFACKLFRMDDLQFIHEGFSDCGHGQRSISRHEKGNSHLSAMFALDSRGLSLSRIDTDLDKQLKTDCNYWKNVLQRIVAVVKFLAERGLPFRGHDEIIGSQANGNYLGILELISQFDPFLAAHIDKYGNRGRGHVSYYASTVCDEFIQIMGQKLFQSIIHELKCAKYFSVSIDSTPDITHIDQLTCVLRYVLDDGPVERVVKFIEICGHTGEELANSLLMFLEQAGININDCRGQSYDNASNMSGKYIGVQARVREKNPKADYIPCFAHSLNLVGKCAADTCTASVSFFDFIQGVYDFFCRSTHRWATLVKALEEGNALVVKRLSDTRWSARADACDALLRGYTNIRGALDSLSEEENTKKEARKEAEGLADKMRTLEIGFMAEFWAALMERFNKSSIILQSEKLDLKAAVKILVSLREYVATLRPKFHEFEERGR